jgi:Peptidase M15
MAKLSPNFLERELHVEQAPDSIKEMAQWGCVNILEPARAVWGPLVITSGYRTADQNKNAGGVEKSFHLYEGRQGAADFYAINKSIVAVFDWMRESALPFDKVILEYDGDTPEVIHVQWALYLNRPRTAWVGATHGASAYEQVECA